MTYVSQPFSVLLQLILVRWQSELRHDQAESCRGGTTMGMRTRLPHGCSHPISDRVTRMQPMQLHLQLSTRDTILQARQILAYRIQELTGKVPELQAFFLEQNAEDYMIYSQSLLLPRYCQSALCALRQTATFANTDKKRCRCSDCPKPQVFVVFRA